MAGGCDTVPTDPNALGRLSGPTAPAVQPISASTATVQMPSVDMSSMAMYPAIMGWGVLYTLGVLLLLFIGAKLGNYTAITNWWSTTVWSSLLLLLVILVTVNASYAALLKNMHMCNNAIKSFVEVAMSLLGVITVIMCYVMYYEFGTNYTTDTYLGIMLHVNFLLSLMTLCLVTMQKLSSLAITKVDFSGIARAFQNAFDPNRNGLTASVNQTGADFNASLARTRSDLGIRS
jgi:hypothetical protein